MGEGIPFGDLIVLGAIALFVILRYRSVLGEKSGHDFSKPKDKQPEPQEKVVQLNGRPVAPAADKTEDMALVDIDNPDATKAIAQMKTLDADFTLHEFLNGAKMAFEMVIAAFNEHDKKTLKMLLAADVYESFEGSIKEHEEKDTRAETTLVAINGAELVDAEVKKSVATITVQFLSEQITVVRDKTGKVVEGSAADIQDIADEWTFERDLKSRDPNWIIVAT